LNTLARNAVLYTLNWNGKKGAKWIAQAEHNKTRGFHLNELVSPWRKWEDIISDFKQAKKSTETLKTFINTSLGETWEEEGEQVEHHHLYKRREFYNAEVPEGALVLTCGVDVQDDRLEYEVVGYGEGYENWGIENGVLHGNPGQPELWKRLDDVLLKKFKHESGALMPIAATAIDSGGHFTQQVYNFCKARQNRRVFAIKGSSTRGSPIIGRPSTSNKAKIKLFSIGTDTAKEQIFSYLQVSEEGAGFCHFPMEYDEEYFLQLTAEKRVTKYRKGFKFQEWVKTRPRNEAIDCRVYGFAALLILNPVFSAIKKVLTPKEEEPEKPQPDPTLTRRRQVRRKPSYLRNY